MQNHDEVSELRARITQLETFIENNLLQIPAPPKVREHILRLVTPQDVVRTFRRRS